MPTWATLLTSILPVILRLMEGYFSWAQAQGYIKQGRLEEIANASGTLDHIVSTAMKAEADADAAHAEDSTDGAFDADFKRTED